MRDSVPSASYSSVCNVLPQWNIPLIRIIESIYDKDYSVFLGCTSMLSVSGC